MLNNKLKEKLFFIFILVQFIFIYYYFTKKDGFLFISERKETFLQIEQYLVDSNKWIFNEGNSQYTSLALFKIDQSILIESLFFSNVEVEKIEDLRCLVKVNEDVILISRKKLIRINLMIKESIWKIKCEFKPKIQFSKNNISIYVAVIENKKIYLNQSFLFQKANIFYENIPKKKAVANCVHMLNINDDQKFNKLLDWIHIQKKFKFDLIVLYIFRLNEEYVKKLKNEFDTQYVKLVKYQTKYKDICHWSLDDNNHNNEAICKKSYDYYFNMSNDLIYNSHERMCSNHCLMNLKYEYEFITNYDFDEFIFPRIFKPNDLKPFKFSTCDEIRNENDYDIYKYSTRLKKYFGPFVACYQFEHVLFLQNYEPFIQNIFKLNEIKKSLKIPYELENRYLYYTMRPRHAKMISTIFDFQPLVRCLNQSITHNKNFSQMWNKIYASVMNMREGKSIFNSDLTESVHQHSASNTIGFSYCRTVPLEFGYVSHMRDLITGFFINQVYDFDFFIFDLEYYYFLFNLTK